MIKKDRGYVRVSTQKDSQKDSPEHQISMIIKHAAFEGVTLTNNDFYEDRSSATTIMDREDVQQMIEDAKKGGIRSIWFASLSRFSRDVIDAVSLKRILVNALKIRVVSIEDGYDSAKKDDELLFNIKAAVNQNTSGDISTSSRRGIEESAEAGNYIGSIAPYGYKKVIIDDIRMKSGKRKTLEVLPDKAEIVRMIYDLYVNQGMGEKSIVLYLNGENERGEVYPSYKGNGWGLTSVQSILQNENYTGFNVYGRHTTEVAYDDLNNLMNRRKKLVKKPKAEWKKTKFPTHEAIISKEMFDRAQDLRLQRGGGLRGGRRSFVNVFAKMIFCKECASAMVTMAGKAGKDGKEYRYLMCSRRRRMGASGCTNDKWIPYAEMRDELINGILLRLRVRLKEFERGVREIGVRVPGGDHDKEKRKLEKRVEDNRRLLFQIRRQNMLGELDKSQYEFEREEYDKEITEAEKRLSQIEAEQRRVIDIGRISSEAQKAIQGLTKLSSFEDVEKVRPLLMQCVQRIEVDKGGEVMIETYI